MPVPTLTESLKYAITLTETLKDAITLSQAVDLVPRRPHVATVWRWATRGVRGIKLRTWLSGGTRVTTPAALEEFLQRLNADLPADEGEAAADLARRAKEAGKALEAMGC